MKKVVLLGDSIRMGYDKFIKEALCGAAEVYYPRDNCRFAQNLLRYAHEWKKTGEWGDDVDLVHWNAGLWDVLDLYGDGPMTPPEFYADLVRRIDFRLRMLFPRATIVFATTTTVLEHKYTGKAKRSNALIGRFNDIAREALRDTGTVFDDLYAVTVGLDDSYYSDMTHLYTQKGTEALGKQVLSCICPLLDVSPADVNMDVFSPEQYSKENVGF